MSKLMKAHLDELKHYHIFGDSLVPTVNEPTVDADLYRLGFLDMSGPEVVFADRPIPSHWRYSLNEAGRAAIVEADGSLPKPYEWDAIDGKLKHAEKRRKAEQAA